MRRCLPRTSYHYYLVLPRDKVERCPKFGAKLDDTSSPLRPSIQLGTRRANMLVGKTGRREFSTTFWVQSKSLASAKCSSSLVYLNRINQKTSSMSMFFGDTLCVCDYGSVVHWSFRQKPGAPNLLYNPVNPPTGSLYTS